MTKLAAPGATALVAAFAPARRVLLPRGMGEDEVAALFGDAWELVEAEAVAGPGVPPPVRRVRPVVYRLIRKDAHSGPGRSGAGPGSSGARARRRDPGRACALAGSWRAWPTPAGQGGHS